MSTLSHLLEQVIDRHDVGLNVMDRRERIAWHSWAEIVDAAQRIGRGLQDRGVRAGDRVAISLPTSIDFVHAFLGVVAGGAVPVPLYPPVRLGRLGEHLEQTRRMLTRSGAVLLVSNRRISAMLEPAWRAARLTRGQCSVAQLSAESGVLEAVEPEDLAMIQFSSGTTARPKGVALTHAAVVAQLDALNALWPAPLTSGHRGVSWLPLYHDMGLLGCLLAALHYPGTLTLIPPELFVACPAVWLRTISRERATLSPAPNFGYGLCVERVRDEELEGVDLSCWQVAIDGAETVSASTMRAFAERFAPWGFESRAFTPVYGLAEAGLAVTFSHLEESWTSGVFDRDMLEQRDRAEHSKRGREVVSVGGPLPGFDIQIVNQNDLVLPDGRVGRVWVRGPSLFREYVDDAEASREARHGDWLDTGDLGFLERGHLYITGRSKDLVLYRGRNIAPEDIERAVDGLPRVRTGCSAAVSWMPERGDRETVSLLVEVRPGPSTDDLVGACRREVLAHCGVELDEVLLLRPGTLPRTSSGKIRRHETLRRLQDRALRPPDRPAWAVMSAAVRFWTGRWRAQFNRRRTGT